MKIGAIPAAITATLMALAVPAAVYSASITMPGGPTITFGSLRLSGQRVEPVQLRYDPGPAESTGNPRSTPPDEDLRQAELLRQKALNAFNRALWTEAILLLQQALEKLPGDDGLIKTLASARVALRWIELEERAAQEAKQRAAEDQAHVTSGLVRLSETLTSLRQQDTQRLVDRGEFEAAIRLPTQADFLIDSSVVDLRDRRGIVDFAVLKPPASLVGDIQFSTVAPPAEPQRLRKARKLLDDPAMESVIFAERMGELIGVPKAKQAPGSRLSDPVIEAVANSLGIDLRLASPAQRALVHRKTGEIWKAYDRRQAEQAQRLIQLRDQSLKDLEAFLGRLKDHGIIKPNENLPERERNSPAFEALMRSQANRIILSEEMTRRETDRKTFDQLLSDVHSILRAKP